MIGRSHPKVENIENVGKAASIYWHNFSQRVRYKKKTAISPDFLKLLFWKQLSC